MTAEYAVEPGLTDVAANDFATTEPASATGPLEWVADHAVPVAVGAVVALLLVGLVLTLRSRRRLADELRRARGEPV